MKKYTQQEIILDVLQSNPSRKFYSFQLQGKQKLGWVGDEVKRRLRELFSENKVKREIIDKHAAYSIK